MNKEISPGIIVAVVVVVLVIVGLIGFKVFTKSNSSTTMKPENDPRYAAHEKNPGQNYMQKPDNVPVHGSPSHGP